MAKPKKPKATTTPTGTADLLTAYNNVYNQFNAGQFTAMALNMHTDIVVKKVARRESISGIGNVVSYLNNQMALVNPAITVSSYTLHPPATSSNYATAKICLAYGEGTYTDDNSGPNGRTTINVHFCWTFVRDEITTFLLLANVYAHRTDIS
jgi:hypothetical protein